MLGEFAGNIGRIADDGGNGGDIEAWDSVSAYEFLVIQAKRAAFCECQAAREQSALDVLEILQLVRPALV